MITEIDHLLEASHPPATRYVLGAWMRDQRLMKGLTQVKVAEQMHIHPTAYLAYEKGRRTPDMTMLRLWCDIVELPPLLVRKLMTMVSEGLYRLDTGAAPTMPGEDDLEHLESFPWPAFFYTFPGLDIVAANAAARRQFPWLAPAPATTLRPVNLLEQLMIHPEATAAITNWDELAHTMTYLLRVLAPGEMPAERLTEILTVCRAHPRFGQFWNTAVPADTFSCDRVTVANPDSGWSTHLARHYQPLLPERPFALLTLTPLRRRSSPAVRCPIDVAAAPHSGIETTAARRGMRSTETLRARAARSPRA
ncbi:MmyB family transcriptional regulator [Nocardia niigatensis]